MCYERADDVSFGVSGVKLRPFGRLSEMRARVHRLDDFRQVPSTPFYAA